MNIAYYNCPLGVLRIVVENESITEVTFIDDDVVTTDWDSVCDALLLLCRLQLDEYFCGERKLFDLPLTINGTDFQNKVWKALQDIPAGRSISYLQLSKILGDPKAIRAVGTANGRNKIAIIVPCHRVIGSNGTLVGYAGKLWRKKWLLDHEAKFCNGVQTIFQSSTGSL